MPRYRIVPDRSEVLIDARSNVHPIHQRARGVEGFVELELGADGTVDGGRLAGEITLATDRLVGSNPLETRELRRRIDAARFPEITGRLDRLRPTGTAGVHLASGVVTFRGVSCPAEEQLTVTVDPDGALHVEGAHEFDIRDFGMDPPRVLVMRVEPFVHVRIDVVAAPGG